MCADCERRRAQLRTASGQLQQAETERRRLTEQLAEAQAELETLRRTMAQYTPLVDTGRWREETGRGRGGWKSEVLWWTTQPMNE